MTLAPLAGLRVLEFSHTVMGPTAGLVLADLGADVIKVEPAPLGDPTRRLGGFASGFFPAFNRNKRSLALNLKSEEGQSVLHRLIGSVDVLIENYGPGTMERLGCGYAQLAALNPRLIYLALKGYLAGPYQHRSALDEVVQFHTGLAYMTGPPDRPLRAGASVIDILGAVFGVVAVQAALRERDATGLGQRVGSALFESAAFLMSTHMAGIVATGEELPPMPARRGAWAIYEVFATADAGQLFIGVTSDQQWTRFAAGLRSSGARLQSAPGEQRNAGPGAVVADPGLAGCDRRLAAGRRAGAMRAGERSLGPGRQAIGLVLRPASPRLGGPDRCARPSSQRGRGDVDRAACAPD